MTIDALTLINTLSLAIDSNKEYVARPTAKSMLQGFLTQLESLSQDQLVVVAEALFGNFDCLSIGGKAGTGKSHVLKLIVELLQSVYDVCVTVVAPTGLASQNVSGHGTINKVFALGLDGDLLPSGMREADPKIRRLTVDSVKPRAAQNLSGGKGLVVIVDEVSLVSSEMLTIMYEIARGVRPRDQKVKFIRPPA
jgi:Cdc6-like AAA superfamily ATPase